MKKKLTTLLLAMTVCVSVFAEEGQKQITTEAAVAPVKNIVIRESKESDIQFIKKIKSGYDRYPLGIYVTAGYKQPFGGSGIALGTTERGKKVTLFPGTGDSMSVAVQYDFTRNIEMGIKFVQRTAIPDIKLKDINVQYLTRGFNADLTIIPFTFEHSRVKVGGGLGVNFTNYLSKDANKAGINIQEYINYYNHATYNIHAEYEHFIFDDKYSIIAGAAYENGEAVFNDANINNTNAHTEDLRTGFETINYGGCEIYIGLARHF